MGLRLPRWYRYHVFKTADDAEKIVIWRCRSVMTAIMLAARLNYAAAHDRQPATYDYERIP